MRHVEPSIMDRLCHDFDAREALLRRVVTDRLAESPPPDVPGHVVASYFLAFRTMTLVRAVDEISYHATSGIKNPAKGSLLAACSARAAGVDPFDASGKVGLLHIAFPLKLMLSPEGKLTSCDLLHTVAAGVIFDMYENQDARLVALKIPDDVVKTFPGPALGAPGVREATGFAPDQPAFGTILKPTAGITPDDIDRLVSDVAGSPILMFIKEDEALHPDLVGSPVADRTRRALKAIERSKAERGGLGLIYAPHVGGAPHRILDHVNAALDAGASALVFSQTFVGGAVRMVREATRNRPNPPALYGHNAGLGVLTRSIWREVLDFLARLDGIDFRQTAPIRPGPPFIRPFGLEWVASEHALTRPVDGIKPTMITRAGALDQGNIILNLQDVEARGIGPSVMFLAGSAINSVKNAQGRPDPEIGLRSLQQAIEVHRSGELKDVPSDEHLDALADVARRRNHRALSEALRQRYPGMIS